MALYAIDGTWSERVHRSNVYYFAMRYQGDRAAYWSGPGTPAASLGWGFCGAMFGTGSKRLAEQVADRVCQDRKHDMYRPIDIVGFSRGAAIANEVANILWKRGCLCERTSNSVKTEHPSIRFLGLFDPVHSMGFPVPTPNGPRFLGNRRWTAHRIPPNVKRSAQVISEDERRAVFRASDLVAPPATRGTPHQIRKFPGDHSDVGGHIENNPYLARWTLRWMVLSARDAGVGISTAGLITDEELQEARRKGLLTPSAGVGKGARPWAL